jgi:citrate lyase subunit beta/citryl-CoA lyase
LQVTLEIDGHAGRFPLAAAAAHWGPINHQGVLHDRASYRYFWARLKEAERTGCPLPPAARDAFFRD